MPVTAGVYSNPGGGNFIAKLDTSLSSIILATTVGSAGSYLEPEAFMTDLCGNIYIAGFGATASYPVTPTALFTTSAAALGGTCYLMVLSNNAASLLYGSFYYGWHVDGGTSRFDPSGSIYLGICMGSTVPVPSWAWDSSAPSWDMFVLKMDFEMAGVNAIASIAPNDTICAGQSVTFTNASNGVQYLWDFGDGTPISTAVSPSHFYSSPGIYNVIFVAIDSASCNIADTAYLSVNVLSLPAASAGNDTTICGGSVQLSASGGTAYSWTPPIGLSNPAISNPVASPAVTTTYVVEVSNGACSDFDTITVTTGAPVVNASGGAICEGDSLALVSSGGISYSWSPSTGLSNTGISNPLASPSITTTYVVVVTDLNGCTATASATTIVNPSVSSEFSYSPAPPYYMNDPLIFTDLSTIPNTWDFGDNTSSSLQSPEHSYPLPGFYTICHTLISGCADTVCKTIEVIPPDILIPNVVTPNGDGQNEYLLFQYLEYYPGSKIEIYNRWGLKLYSNDNYKNNWEGSEYSDGVYYFILYLNKNGDYTSIPGFFHILKEK
jgi:gliding motility-associated-like protein